MLLAAAVAILATMALALARAILGPSVYDRVLAVNMFGTKTVLLLALMAFAIGRTDFLDLALAYALINFIGVLAVLWFVKDSQRHRQRHPAPEPTPTGGGAEAQAATPASPEPEPEPQLPGIPEGDSR